MTAPTPRLFTPARLVALALLAVLVGGLGYLRLAPASGSVSVPDGARAGDLILHGCDYETEKGPYEADCGKLIVRENRADPQSRLIALPVTRIHARSDHPREPIFRLEGGPGVTNMHFRNASRFADDHDVVLVGYRGVDGSVKLDCPEVESAIAHSTDRLGEKALAGWGDAFRACADRLTDDGFDVTRYGLVQQVDDLEAARKALGYGRIDLLSESAGTRTAMIYAWRYPKSIRRSVMIGVNPPGNFMWDAKTTDEQLGRYADLCAADDGCSKRTDDLAATMKRRAAHMPDRWLFLPIEEDNVRVASLMALMESSSASPFNGPAAIDAWLSADEGDASGLWFSSLAGDLVFPKMFTWGQYASAGIIDAEAAREYFSSPRPERDTNLGDAATTFVWGGGRLADAWPAAAEASDYTRVRPSNVETLLIGGTLDFSTPPQIATKELLPQLPNGHEVVLDGFGHTISFWEEQPEAGTRLIKTFFASGKVDDSLYTPQSVDFTPSVGFGAIAKIALAAMLSLAGLTVLMLVWMARRVCRRGRFGRKASAALRSLSPVVLGLGGWVLGLLIVLTTMPGVPIDDPLLAVLAVGVPVGLGIYYAWADSARPARAKTAGIVGATAGALAGAWLGFGATDGLVALLTAIVGAAAGANLLLLGLDIARDRSARTLARSSRALAPAEA